MKTHKYRQFGLTTTFVTVPVQLMEFAPNREALRDFLFSSDFIVTQ